MKELRDLEDFRGGYRSCPFSLPVQASVFVLQGSVTSVWSEQRLVMEHGLAPCHSDVTGVNNLTHQENASDLDQIGSIVRKLTGPIR